MTSGGAQGGYEVFDEEWNPLGFLSSWRVHELVDQGLFELVEKELTRSGYRDLLSAGLILTGGTSLLVGVKELAEDQLGLPTKIGEPHVERPAELTSPIYATVVGLVLYGIKRREELVSEERLGMRIKEWLKEFF